jgi:hypothetical protein
MSNPVLHFVGLPVHGTSNPKLHLTVCVIQTVLHAADDVLRDTKALAAAVLPLKIRFGHRDFFGQNKQIPVRHVEIVEPEKKQLLHDFWRKYFQPTAPWEAGRTEQVYHVNVKDLSVEEADALGDMELNGFFIRVVGRDEVIWQWAGH